MARRKAQKPCGDAGLPVMILGDEPGDVQQVLDQGGPPVLLLDSRLFMMYGMGEKGRTARERTPSWEVGSMKRTWILWAGLGCLVVALVLLASASRAAEDESGPPADGADDEDGMQLRVYDVRDLLVIGQANGEPSTEILQASAGRLFAFVAGCLGGLETATSEIDAYSLAPRMFFRGGNPGDLIVIAPVSRQERLEHLLWQIRRQNMLLVELKVRAFVFKKDAFTRGDGLFRECVEGFMGEGREETEAFSEGGPVVVAAAKGKEMTESSSDALAKAALWHNEETLRVSCSRPTCEMKSLRDTEVSAFCHADRRQVTVRVTIPGTHGGVQPALYAVTAPVEDQGTLIVVETDVVAQSIGAAWMGQEDAKKLDLGDGAFMLLIHPRITVTNEEEMQPF